MWKKRTWQDSEGINERKQKRKKGKKRKRWKEGWRRRNSWKNLAIHKRKNDMSAENNEGLISEENKKVRMEEEKP